MPTKPTSPTAPNQPVVAEVERLQRLALAAERSSNTVVLSSADGTVTWVNQAFTIMTGLTPEASLGERLGVLLERGRADSAGLEQYREALAQGQAMKCEISLRSTRGDVRWALMDMQPMRTEGGELTGWVTVATDLTDLRAQQRLLTLAIDGAGLGTWQWEVRTGAMQCNDRMLEIMGYQRGQFQLHSDAWNAMIHQDDLPSWIAAVTAQLRDSTAPLRMSMRLQHQSGRWAWIMFVGAVVDRTDKGHALRMAGVAIDVQAQKTLEHELRTAAHTDVLTQLPNRSAVYKTIELAIQRRKAQPGYHFAVLFMDFDRFKQVNDTLGHGVGDDLLRQIAARLQQSLRPGDSLRHTGDLAHMAARIGGDEFVVLLDDIRGDLDAEVVAGRLIDVLSLPYSVGTNKVNSSVSIGIVTSSHATDDADAALRDADIAMYEAKRTGRARYVVFEPSMRQQVSASVALENDLRQALEKQELFVVYQPLVNLATGSFTGMEALLRWRHPLRGLVSPVEFIPVAEASGLIASLGQFVLETACSNFSAMQLAVAQGVQPTLAVNLSRAQLRQPGLVADVRDALRANGLAPQQLVLEVTESLAAQDEEVLTTLHGIRALGVALSLDDFGTGYSSLSCLHELPVNFVKVDRSFVSQAQGSAYHRVLIEATIRMAQTLGLGTVAEGIETEGQARLMAELGCDKGQGYLYGKPLEAQALVAWVQGRA